MHCAVHDTVLPNSSDDVIVAFRIAWTHEARSANSQVNKAGAGRTIVSSASTVMASLFSEVAPGSTRSCSSQSLPRPRTWVQPSKVSPTLLVRARLPVSFSPIGGPLGFSIRECSSLSRDDLNFGSG